MQTIKYDEQEMRGHECYAKHKLGSLFDLWKKKVQPLLLGYDSEIESKDALIKQMLSALEETMILLDSVPTMAHEFAKDEKLQEIGRIVNVKGLYGIVKAAIEVAKDHSES